jgi:hypothetical protein
VVMSSGLQVFVLSVLVVGKEGDVPVLEVSFEDRKGWKKEAAADEISHSFFFGRWVVPQVVGMAMSSFKEKCLCYKV